MPLFGQSTSPVYVGQKGASPSACSNGGLFDDLFGIFGGSQSPSYLNSHTPTPGPQGARGSALVSFTISSPALTKSAPIAKSSAIAVQVPAGATSYEAWFTPVFPLSSDVLLTASPIGLDESPAGAVPTGTAATRPGTIPTGTAAAPVLTFTPTWALGAGATSDVGLGSIGAVLFVEFR
jgi:hypothetical protein